MSHTTWASILVILIATAAVMIAPATARADTWAYALTSDVAVNRPVIGVTFSTMGVSDVQFERQSTTHANFTCGAWPDEWSWSAVGGVNPPGMEFADYAVVDNRCYRYRLSYIGYGTQTSEPTEPVRVDLTMPTGSINPVGTVTNAGTHPLSGSGSDSGSRDNGAVIEYEGPTGIRSEACGSVDEPIRSSNSGGWQCDWDVDGLPAGIYTVKLRVFDEAWNEFVATRTVVVEQAAVVQAGAEFEQSVVELAEGGVGVARDLRLTSAPTHPVTVEVQNLDPDQITIDRSTLTFTPANWNVKQRIVLTAVDDAIAEYPWENNAFFDLVFHSDDSRYDLFGVPRDGVTIEDNDAAGISVDATDFELDEGALTAVGIVLDSEPTAPVTVDVDPVIEPGIIVTPRTFTFDATNWNIPQSVTIEAVANHVQESHRTFASISLVSDSTHQSYMNLQTAIDFEVLDDDAADFDVDQAELEVTEGGAGDSFGVRLTSEPAATVTLAVNTDAQVTAAPASLTFTPANWSTRQSVEVAAVDDAIDEETRHDGSIDFEVTTTDDIYEFLGDHLASPRVEVVDNDAGGAVIDTTAPVGGSIANPAVTTRSQWVDVDFATGSDAGTGIASWRLQRRVAQMSGGACGTWSGWTSIGAERPASPFRDAPTNGVCAHYRLVTTDGAGNTATTTTVSTTRIDRVAPFGSIESLEPLPARGTIRLQGMAVDTATVARVQEVRFTGRGDGVICVAPTLRGGIWGCTWNTTNVPDGSYTLSVGFADDADNVSTQSLTVEVRNATTPPPAVDPGTVTPVPAQPVESTRPTTPRGGTELDATPPKVSAPTMPRIAWNGAIMSTWNASDNSGATPRMVIEHRSTNARSGWSGWKTMRAATEMRMSMASATRGTTTCLRIVASDASGNSTTSGASCFTYPLDDRDLAASSGWKRSASAASYQRTLSSVPRSGAASLTTTVASSDLTLLASTCATCGSVQVRYGSRIVATVSLRSSTPKSRVELKLPAATAGAKVTLTPSGSGAVQIDGLVVLRR